jgi:hypothetical protein
MSIKKEVRYLNEILIKQNLKPVTENCLKDLIDNKKKLPKNIQEGIRKTINSVFGVFLGGWAAWVIYRFIRSAIDTASSRCGVLAINTTRRQNCMYLAKIQALERTLHFVSNLSTIKPEKKKQLIDNINKKIEKLKIKISKNNPTKIRMPSDRAQAF